MNAECISNEAVVRMTDSSIMRTYGRLPIALVRGQGAYAWDADGKRYLDFLTGLAVNSLGHCHPKVVQAIADQAGTLIHCSNLYHIDKQAILARTLTSLSGLGKAFFCNSGAEANEGAIKLARKHSKTKFGPGRFSIVTAKESFHGRTLAAVTATGQAKYQQGFEPLLEGFSHAEFNDLSAMEAAVDETTCAIMLEPIQGESGVHPATLDYLQGVRRLCDERQILLILDEVQTGIGRTGRMFAHEHYGIRPDIMTLAKALAGGVPIGCLLARDDVAESFGPGNHASTFGGNPLACAAGIATLKAIEDEGLLELGTRNGELIVATIKGWRDSHPVLSRYVGDVRGRGMMVGFDLLGVDGGLVLQAAQERGLLINSIAGRTIRLLPPLVLTSEQVSEGLSILEAALVAVAKSAGVAN